MTLRFYPSPCLYKDILQAHDFTLNTSHLCPGYFARTVYETTLPRSSPAGRYSANRLHRDLEPRLHDERTRREMLARVVRVKWSASLGDPYSWLATCQRPRRRDTPDHNPIGRIRKKHPITANRHFAFAFDIFGLVSSRTT